LLNVVRHFRYQGWLECSLTLPAEWEYNRWSDGLQWLEKLFFIFSDHEVCFLCWGELCAIIKQTNPAFCKQTRSALLKENSTRKQTERNVQKRGQFERTYSGITNIVF